MPSYDPRIILATREGAWIGMSSTSLHPAEGQAFQRDDRGARTLPGRGLSLALKLLAIRFVRVAGYRRLATIHHPRNASAIAMNRRLGFVDRPKLQRGDVHRLSLERGK